MFASLMVLLSSISLAKSAQHQHIDRCHTDTDCSGLTKCGENGFCVISAFKVEVIGFLGALIVCSVLGTYLYQNISFIIGRHIQYSEVVSRDVRLNGNKQKETTDEHRAIDTRNDVASSVIGNDD